MAKVFEVSVDFLIGEGANATYDKEMVKRLDDMDKLAKEGYSVNSLKSA